jgi:hypothetical protein
LLKAFASFAYENNAITKQATIVIDLYTRGGFQI